MFFHVFCTQADDVDVSASVLEGVIICTPKPSKTTSEDESKTDGSAAAATAASSAAAVSATT